MTTLPCLKDKPYGGASSIHDASIKAWLYNSHFYFPEVDTQQFLSDYYAWIQQGNQILGCGDYNTLAYSNGTTEAFDKFYQKHTHRRLRLWRGEYYYHQIQRRELFTDFAWIDEEPVSSGDVVVVSMPFADTGGIPTDYTKVMQECVDKEVPVLIDMAYISLTKNCTYDISYPCIETVTTSLSKVFPVEHMRIGIRMNRHNTDDTLDAYTNNAYPYVNTIGVHVGHRLIKQFEQNWVYNKWRNKQKEMCEQLDVQLSDCIIFGIDTNNKYSEYNRGGATNRLCLSKHLDGRWQAR